MFDALNTSRNLYAVIGCGCYCRFVPTRSDNYINVSPAIETPPRNGVYRFGNAHCLHIYPKRVFSRLLIDDHDFEDIIVFNAFKEVTIFQECDALFYLYS